MNPVLSLVFYPKDWSFIQGRVALDETKRTYRKLKSVRTEIKRRLNELYMQSRTEHAAEMDELEEETKDLAEKKTFLRKKFERLAKRKGPYRIRPQ